MCLPWQALVHAMAIIIRLNALTPLHIAGLSIMSEVCYMYGYQLDGA